MSTFRILVTGSRTFDDTDLMERALAQELAAHDDYGRSFTLVHGGCRGADQIADKLWREWMAASAVPMLNEPEVHPADWTSYGHRAGPIRNQHMVNAGADLLLAFPRGKASGTRDCVRRGRKAGIHVVIHAEPVVELDRDDHLTSLVHDAHTHGLYEATADPKRTR